MMFFIFAVLLNGCDMYLGKCPENGYEALVEFKEVQNDFMEQIEEILMKKNYEIAWRERKIFGSKIHGENYTTYIKEIGEEPYNEIVVHIKYSIDHSNDLLNLLFIEIKNDYRGSVVKKLKDEIEALSKLFYDKFSMIIGENKISIQYRKTIAPMCLGSGGG